MRDRRQKTEGVPLPPLVAQLRESCEASARLYGGTTYYTEEVGIFRAYADRHQHFLTQAPDILDTQPTAEGNEHQVWYCEEQASFLKATWPNHFGMKVVHRQDEEPQCSPIDYLERWRLHNELFGDSVEFLGVLDTPRGMRLLITQPAIEGAVASQEQIHEFFQSSGWLPFKVDGNIAYYDPSREIVVSDTHQGNIIAMEDGQLAPIDLRAQLLSPALISIVQSLCPTT
ncbi:hypothetical protein Rhal01_03812 [Rubritalea halochordaticola]|uniref:Uncharacterized protein n=1 Tax=Rubritalea halochordaticola TaxID=714537 RepID=A0ABP9V986_9BACT